MPTELCAYGFSCASMMLQPGITAQDCPNKDTCGTIIKLTEEEIFELQIARIENQRRILERVRLNNIEAAKLMLERRGCSQTPESLGVTGSIAELEAQISQLRLAIEELSNEHYIAPPSVEAHRYTVKRPYGVYQYNKLSSKDAIFPPQIEERDVKVLHLSRDTDPRNLVGRSGIERRNRLLAIKTSLDNATKMLCKAISLAEEDVEAIVEEKIARMIVED